MPKNNPILNYWLPLILLAFINALFTYKYSIRISQYAFALTAIYSMLFVSIPFIVKLILHEKLSRIFLYTVIAVYCLADIYFIYATDPLKLNVDRWSVITSFWDYGFSGKFPYQAKSHLGNAPGPFPFYFVMALPFYFMHQIGYFSLAGLFVLLYFIFRQKADIKEKASITMLVLLSTSVIWELTTRSTMLVNSSLILVYAWWLLSIKVFNVKNLIIGGIAGGLLLSTRSLVLIPLVVIYSNLFLKERKWKEALILGTVLTITFILTLLPFALWDYKLFILYNPLTLQGDFLPGPVIPIFMLLCLIVGLFIKVRANIYFYCGLMLFLIMAIYFVYRMITVDASAFMEDKIDISYFIFSMPFLFAALFGKADNSVSAES